MDITHYAFAAYVFLLVCGGIWFFGKVFNSGKKNGNDKTAYEKEQHLFTLYQNVEDMLNSFEEYAEQTKKETEQTLKRAEDMLEEVRRLSERLDGQQPGAGQTGLKAAPPQPAQREAQPWETEQAAAVQRKTLPPDEMDTSAGPPLKTNDKIRLLDAQGLGATDIAKTLGISVREVTLVLEMIRK